MNYLQVSCPHCSGEVQFDPTEVHCGIVRHAVFKNNAEPLHPHAPVQHSSDVVAALLPRLRDATREHFFALALDVKNRPIAEILVAVGSLSACTVSPADVFRLVLKEPAAGVIFVHNHPSGEPTPSADDVSVTDRLQKAGALLGVKVLDHVILGYDTHFSFLDAGMLK